MKIPFTLFLVTCCLNLFAQEPRRFVFDKTNNSPVPFATVKVLHAPKGRITTASGEFRLAIEPTDTVLFSSVGFEDFIIPGNQIGDTVFLKPSAKSLAPITIRTRKVITNFLVGNGAAYVNKKVKCACFGPGQCKSSINGECLSWGPGGGVEFAEAISPPDSTKSYQLGKVWLPIGEHDCWQPLYLHLYAIDSITKAPGELLLTKYITKSSGVYKKGKIAVDLAYDNFVMEKTGTFFISLQWDTEFPNKDCLTTQVLIKSEKANTFSRSILYANYKWGVFGLQTQYPGSYHTMFAIELKELKD